MEKATFAKNILLVEDSKFDIELTLHAFKEIRPETRIHIAPGGRQALEYLEGQGQYADRERFPWPDLVLLDLKMPGIDGFEVLKRVKSTPILKRLPIVIFTSSKEEVDRCRSYDGGANSYLLKPVDFEGFLCLIQQIEQYWLISNVEPPRNVS